MNAYNFEKIEQIIIDLMTEFKIPGLSIGLINEGKPVYAKGFGARNLEENLPFDEDTLFGVGSISKSFTTIALLQLVEQQKIDLEDPVNKYIDFKLDKDDKNKIKICHMLSHSSGVPELSGNVVAIVRKLGNLDAIIPMSSWHDFLLHIKGASSETFGNPDEYFFYNNDMFTCVGLIIEKLTNMKFELFIKKHILEPLGMNRSSYLKEDFENDNNTATGYIASEEVKPYKDRIHPFDKIVYAPGGLFSSAKEMQNYIIALINRGIFNNSKILAESSVEKMWTPYIKMPEQSYGVENGWYGFGWVIEQDFFGTKLIQHGGDVGTSTAFLAIIPEKKMGVILGANADASIVLSSLARLVLANLLNQDIDRAAPSLRLHHKLKSLTGKYSTYKNLENIEILFENGILYADIKDSLDFFIPLKLPLVPENLQELKFYVPVLYPNRKIKIQFNIDETTQQPYFTFDRYYFHKK